MSKEKTITCILQRVDAEVAQLLTEQPKYCGDMTIKLNFKDGRCPNMNVGNHKSVIVEK